MSEIINLARQAADAVDEGFIVRLAQDLVRIKSVFDESTSQGNEARVVTFLQGILESLDLKVCRQEVAPGRANLIADWHGCGAGKTLLFEGHTDVVTEGNHEDWRHPPFAGVIEDGRLYGRGSADMKGGVAAAIAAVKAVAESAAHLPGGIRLGFVCDEERLMIGIKDFIRRGWAENVDGAIVCEPEENEICLVQKGALRLQFTIRGKMAHGAMPYAGVNPILPAARLIEKIAGFEHSQQQILGTNPLLGDTHMTPTNSIFPARATPQHNVMAGDGVILYDVRTIPGQDHGDLVAELQRIAMETADLTPGCQIECQVIEDRPWTETAKTDPLVAAVQAACLNVGNTGARFGGVPGTTDGTYLASRAKVPIVVLGPGDRSIPHQIDEYLDIDQLLEAARIYAAAAVFFLADRLS